MMFFVDVSGINRTGRTIRMMKEYRDTDPKGYKISNNEILLEMCKSVWYPDSLKRGGRAFYLDGPNMISSSIFSGHFRDLFIAQCDPEDYKEMKRNKDPHYNIHIENMTVRKYIETKIENIKNCQLYYLDYMNCVYGSITKKEYPLHDLDQILKHCTNRGIVLGLTFVSRMIMLEKPVNENRKEHFSMTMNRESTKTMWYDFILPTLRSRGYDVYSGKCIEYCRETQNSAPMVFFGLILEKKDHLPLQIFHMHPSNIFRVGFDQEYKDECYRVNKTTKEFKEAYKEFYDTKKKEWRMPWKMIDSS